MVLLVWMGMSHRMVTLSFSVIVLGSCSFHRSFTSKPNYLQIFQYLCSAALLRRWIARDQVVNSLIETVTQSTFWVHVRLLEDVVLYQRVGRPWSWAAMIKLSVSALRPAAFSHLWFCLGPPASFTRCGTWPWFCGLRWCSPHPLQVVYAGPPSSRFYFINCLLIIINI